jgi:hypothetical protein
MRQPQQVIKIMPAATIHMLDPAHTLIEALGGRTFVAEQLDIDRSTISRWCQPHPTGTDGQIPVRYWKAIMALGRQSGVEITLSDLSGIKP